MSESVAVGQKYQDKYGVVITITEVRQGFIGWDYEKPYTYGGVSRGGWEQIVEDWNLKLLQ